MRFVGYRSIAPALAFSTRSPLVLGGFTLRVGCPKTCPEEECQRFNDVGKLVAEYERYFEARTKRPAIMLFGEVKVLDGLF